MASLSQSSPIMESTSVKAGTDTRVKALEIGHWKSEIDVREKCRNKTWPTPRSDATLDDREQSGVELAGDRLVVVDCKMVRATA